jgi:hypothetical protein
MNKIIEWMKFELTRSKTSLALLQTVMEDPRSMLKRGESEDSHEFKRAVEQGNNLIKEGVKFNEQLAEAIGIIAAHDSLNTITNEVNNVPKGDAPSA